MAMPLVLSMEQYKAAFNAADKSKDGKCSVMEVAQHVAKTYGLPPKDAIKIFSDCDKDANMSINFEEFQCICNKANAQRFALLFDKADTDHSGKISLDEFIKSCSKGPVKDVNKLKQLFTEADKDKSGQLSKDEFLSTIKKY